MDVGGPCMPAPCLGGDFPHFKAAKRPPAIPAVLVSFTMLGHGMLIGTICILGSRRGREGGGADRGGTEGGGMKPWCPTSLPRTNFLDRLAVGNPRPCPRPLPSTSASAGPAPSLDEPASSSGQLTTAPAGPAAALLTEGGGRRHGVLPPSSI